MSKQREQQFFHADINLKLCSSSINRQQILDQEGFPLEKNAWFELCDKVEQLIPLLTCLNIFLILIGLPSTILIILGLVLNDSIHLFYIGLSLIVVEILVEYVSSKIVPGLVGKRVEELSAQLLQDKYPNVTVQLEDEPSSCLGWFFATGDRYFLHVIVNSESGEV